jgi:putative ABC transport system permease protein
MMETLLQDIKQALRAFRNSPAFTITAVLALTLGIGANTAIFSVINAVLLEPVAFPEPDTLVQPYVVDRRRSFELLDATASPAMYVHWRAQTDVLAEAAAYRTVSLTLNGEVPERVIATHATESYFRVFGARVERGRAFSPEEDAPGASGAAVISHDFWTRRFGGDTNVVGTVLSLNGAPHTVVGVMAPQFGGRELGDVDAWLPFQIDPDTAGHTQDLQVAARLAPGVSLAQAQAALSASGPAYLERFSNNAYYQGIEFSALPFQTAAVGSQTKTTLWVMAGAVAAVLLIACANVASLLLVRALGRRREIAIRSALGAGRRRILRQLLTESVLLSVAGGALGLLLGFIGIRALLFVDTAGLPRLAAGGSLITMDWRVIAFTLTLSLFTAVVFGFVPAWTAWRNDLGSVVKGSGNKSGGRRESKARAALVIVELGLAVVLLVGASLLIRTSLALNNVDPGFTVDNVLVMRTALSEPRFLTSAGIEELSTNTLARIRAVPGVEAATASLFVPLQRSFGEVFNIIGRDNGGRPVTGGGDIAISTGDYFATFEIPVLRGRSFDERDDAGALPVVVISRTLAERHWPGGDDPVGAQMQIGGGPVRQVIGVVEDVRALRLSNVPRQIMYLPLAQVPDGQFTLENEQLAWIARANIDPSQVSAAIQTEVRQATRAAVTDVQTMADVLSGSISRQRFNMVLMTVFSGAALLLAAIGIYGLVAFAVQQRTHEIGIRMALGAGSGNVKAMVFRHGMSLVAIGAAIGLVAAFLLSQLLASFLFGVESRDPAVFVGVPAILLLAAGAAVLVPAHRASRVNPLDALHHD